MPSRRLQGPPVRTASGAVALAALLAVGLFAGAALADDHTRDDAPHYEHDESGNATFEFLNREDHYPGAENVSVQYTVKGGETFDDVGATDGIAADWFVVETDAVDHGDCDTDNVATFAIDRDDDGEYDEESDEDLLRYTRTAMYFDDSIVVEFYDYEDFGGDPPRIGAEDRIVLELSDESAGGACADTTEEPGWYTAETFLNGTGPQQSDRSDEQYGFTIESERNYVCECDDEEEAREQLGYEPGPATPTGTSEGTATPTDTAAPTETPTPTEQPRTPTPDGTPILTATVDESVGNASVSANASVGEDDVSADVSLDADDGGGAPAAANIPSPTPADGSGFGVGVAVATLLATTLLARRRGS